MDINEVLKERSKTHGAFEDHARITQRLKSVIDDELVSRRNRDQDILADTQLESIDMILHKIGRIIAGDANFPDHWDDIAGYAKLCGSK